MPNGERAEEVEVDLEHDHGEGSLVASTFAAPPCTAACEAVAPEGAGTDIADQAEA